MNSCLNIRGLDTSCFLIHIPRVALVLFILQSLIKLLASETHKDIVEGIVQLPSAESCNSTEILLDFNSDIQKYTEIIWRSMKSQFSPWKALSQQAFLTGSLSFGGIFPFIGWEDATVTYSDQTFALGEVKFSAAFILKISNVLSSPPPVVCSSPLPPSLLSSCPVRQPVMSLLGQQTTALSVCVRERQ